MSSLSISVGTSGSHAGRASVSRSLICPGRGFLAADLLRNSSKLRDRVWLKGLEQPNGRSVHKFRVFAKLRKGKGLRKFDPWYKDIDQNLQTGHLSYLSDFKPLKQKPKPVILEFEKRYINLEKKLHYVRKLANDTGLDFSDQINFLEEKYQKKLEELYMNLTPYQRLSIARHPNRPTFLDHVLNMTEKWVELHGDRAGYDDPAVVTGLGSMDGQTFMFIGQQKGRDTKENIKRNFAMPTPHGYRKAKRLMQYADHHGLPIVTFVDTAGAYADMKSEELGQGEAIANNLRTMFSLKVPIISIVIGEGGSGGALAIACANKLFMLENSVFYVASPEASAAILWKSAKFASRAASRMRISAEEHYRLKIADAVIPEPVGGAHVDPSLTAQRMKLAILKAMEELAPMTAEELIEQRQQKFRLMGTVGSNKDLPLDYKRKLKMKPSGKILRMKPTSPVSPSKIAAHASSPGDNVAENPAKMHEGTEMEMEQVVKSAEVRHKLEQLQLEDRNGLSQESIKKLTKEIEENIFSMVKKTELKESAVMLKAIRRSLDELVESAGLIHKIEEVMGEIKSGSSKERITKLREEIKKDMLDMRENINLRETAEILIAIGNTNGEIKSDSSQKRHTKVGTRSTESILATLEKAASIRPDMAEKIAEISAVIGNDNEQAVDSVRLRPKMERDIEKVLSQERITKLEKEHEEGILAVMDSSASKEEAEGGLTPEAVGVDRNVGADNGRA